MDWHDLACSCPGVSFKLDFSDIRADIEETDRGVETPTREEIRWMRWGVRNGNTNQSIRFVPKIDNMRTRALKALLVCDLDLTYPLVAHIFISDLLFGTLVENSRLSRPLLEVSHCVCFFTTLSHYFQLTDWSSGCLHHLGKASGSLYDSRWKALPRSV
jgi:hypothetical protein